MLDLTRFLNNVKDFQYVGFLEVLRSERWQELSGVIPARAKRMNGPLHVFDIHTHPPKGTVDEGELRGLLAPSR